MPQQKILPRPANKPVSTSQQPNVANAVGAVITTVGTLLGETLIRVLERRFGR